ncbi:MAG: YicC family protein [Lachnospiraceae bacterium]|nr:YicC family protein [Lachnospiraceae bacterium]
MIRSMTGYGRKEAVISDRKFTVEIKAVNHRYLDLSVKVPRRLSFLEIKIRNYLKERMERGKVDCFVFYENLSENDLDLRYNEGLAEEYMNAFQRMKERFGLEDDVRLSTLARCPDVFLMEEKEIDEDELFQMLKVPLDGALEKFLEAREKEGEALKTDLLSKLSDMEKDVEKIEERVPEIIVEYKASLREKVKDLLEDNKIDEGRLAAEVTLFADRMAVDEELVRLKSHIRAMEQDLTKGGSVGRKLDFIAQEMNREANTILSKSTDLAVSDTGILLKTGIEKIREQIQNLE